MLAAMARRSQLMQVTRVLVGLLFAVVGGYIFFLQLGRLLRGNLDGWGYGDIIIGFVLGAYLLATGVLMTYRSGDDSYRNRPRVRWGMVVFGAVLLYIQAKQHFQPTPELLKADNVSQAQGMVLATLILMVLAIFLIFWGFYSRFHPQRPDPGAVAPPPPEILPQ
jgi:hypothetical protein